MGITTLWALEQDTFDKSDVAWCTGLGVDVTIEPLYGNVYTGGKGIHQYVRGLSIRIKTTCEKQESMLQLKYGSRLIEIQRSTELSYDERQQFGF